MSEKANRNSQSFTSAPLLQIGTSGWIYKHWMGIFYPPKLPAPEQLGFYTQHFPTVEVNFSFYRLPERSVFETWRTQTPSEFLFAVKGSRFLTHMKKLKDPEEPLSRLMERASGLQEKLGPILFQFLTLGRLIAIAFSRSWNYFNFTHSNGIPLNSGTTAGWCHKCINS